MQIGEVQNWLCMSRQSKGNINLSKPVKDGNTKLKGKKYSIFLSVYSIGIHRIFRTTCRMHLNGCNKRGICVYEFEHEFACSTVSPDYIFSYSNVTYSGDGYYRVICSR